MRIRREDDCEGREEGDVEVWGAVEGGGYGGGGYGYGGGRSGLETEETFITVAIVAAEWLGGGHCHPVSTAASTPTICCLSFYLQPLLQSTASSPTHTFLHISPCLKMSNASMA